jgi:hypothetical protein
MDSKPLALRLKPDEWEMLAHVCNGEVKRNPSEMMRLLLHREYYRRTTGKSIVPDGTIATEFRNGRPCVANP